MDQKLLSDGRLEILMARVMSSMSVRFLGGALCVLAEEAKQAAEAERERRARVDWFVGVLGGKERRVREMTPGVINGRCAPLAGFKIGPDVRLGSGGWRLAPSIGVAVNTRDGEHASLFGEAELNYWIREKGFIGTGAEGRLFFDQLDDIDNNYQAWAVLRVVFR